jgi:VWFA-related protein
MRLIVTLGLLLPSIALAQLAPGSAPQTPSLRTQSNLVIVPALVRGGDGKLVFTLKADDFRLTDDGVEQKLTLDQDTGDEPLALVIAVQTGGTGRSKIDNYSHLGTQIGNLVGGVPHEIAVVGFDSAPRLLLGFTADTEAAGSTLRDLDRGDKGAAIIDALRFSVDLLRKQPSAYRRAILLISETNDHDSQTKMDDALRVIGDTNTAIYSLAFSSAKADASHYAYRELPIHKTDGGVALGSNANPGPPHGCMGKDPDPDATQNKAVQAFDCAGLLAPPLALAKLAAIAAADGMKRNLPETVAQLTGGEYFKFEDSRGLTRALLTISNHVPNRYVLSFHPQSPHAGYHAVELRLRDYPKLQVTARTNYWVDEEGAVQMPAQSDAK